MLMLENIELFHDHNQINFIISFHINISLIFLIIKNLKTNIRQKHPFYNFLQTSSESETPIFTLFLHKHFIYNLQLSNPTLKKPRNTFHRISKISRINQLDFTHFYHSYSRISKHKSLNKILIIFNIISTSTKHYETP